MKSFSFLDRTESIEQLESTQFDLFIIGGGITGAGVARDAALRGLKVALVEMQDFAAGTSSRSSKLIHGGIRYLENFEFKLVFEALSERNKLFEIAPHLAHPLRFMIPIYKSSRYGLGMMRLGMWAYDALSLFQAPELHETLSAEETCQRQPALQKDELLGSVVYSDAYMDDDRLVFETLRSANEAGAVCINYVKADQVIRDSNGKITSIICQDLIGKKNFKISARHYVSTVGPWTDQLGVKVRQTWKNILRPTKGVHLTFRKGRVPLSSAVVMGTEKRIVFGIPRHDMVIIGTTDTDFQGDPAQVKTDKADIEYLLQVTHQYFPGSKITEKDIIASYAGVRPLVADGSDSEGKTSREHTIFTENEEITYVAGGKYTTYRLMSEQIVDECLRFFPLEDRVKWNRCVSHRPLNALISEESRRQDPLLFQELSKSASMTDAELALLIERHSAEARVMVEKWKGFSYWEIEAAHAILNTMCFHLVDFYTRRAPLVLGNQDHGLSLLPQIAPIFAHYLGWDQEKLKTEEQTLKKYLQDEFAWRQKSS
jgi:glycerol-3-phosphate dehydrogenase